jgi:hypothetical protein
MPDTHVKTESSILEYLLTKPVWAAASIALFLYQYSGSKYPVPAEITLMAITSIVMPLVAAYIIPLLFFTAYVFLKEPLVWAVMGIVIIPGIIGGIFESEFVTNIIVVYYIVLLWVILCMYDGWKFALSVFGFFIVLLLIMSNYF